MEKWPGGCIPTCSDCILLLNLLFCNVLVDVPVLVALALYCRCCDRREGLVTNICPALENEAVKIQYGGLEQVYGLMLANGIIPKFLRSLCLFFNSKVFFIENEKIK